MVLSELRLVNPFHLYKRTFGILPLLLVLVRWRRVNDGASAPTILVRKTTLHFSI
jgi:hypothetical protein